MSMSVTTALPFSKNMPANAGSATKISAMLCHCSVESSVSSLPLFEVRLRERWSSRMLSVSTEVRENYVSAG
jgi:hypothetical protein